jgi:hypothetical protein
MLMLAAGFCVVNTTMIAAMGHRAGSAYLRRIGFEYLYCEGRTGFRSAICIYEVMKVVRALHR